MKQSRVQSACKLQAVGVPSQVLGKVVVNVWIDVSELQASCNLQFGRKSFAVEGVRVHLMEKSPEQKVIFKKYSTNVTRKKQKEPEVKLTIREVEIVKLISEGLTSHQIADKLFISHRTVETHRANLMKKVNVKNAIELVNKVKNLGLL